MTFQPGDVVVLKSGGQFMTVSGVSEDEIQCIWIGEEGELFRETLPLAVLRAAEDEIEEDDDDGEADEVEAEGDDTEEVRKIA
jgi:uncharacterized protein YodC (DUF2158 family)